MNIYLDKIALIIKKLEKALHVFIFILFAASAEAQSQMVFRSYSVNEGLSHNFVTTTIQKVALSDNANQNGSQILPITITPPWWQTLPARLIAILLIIFGLFVAFRLRTSRVERRNKKLELEVSERTSKLTKVNDELILSQKSLKVAYNNVRLTTDALNEIALIIKGDANGNILEVNKMFLETTGYDRSEIIGKKRSELTDSLFSSDVHTPDFFKTIQDTIRNGETWKGEVCCRTKSGNFIWLLKNIIPILDHGIYSGYFSFGYDITHRKKQEEEIVKAKRIAEKASETRESFLSIMSHEIRTPLNSVIGLSNLLLKRNPREDQLEILRTLKSSSDNLMYLINNILDYNKIWVGKMELEHLSFNLNEKLQLLHRSHELIAQEKGLDFKISIVSNTPTQLVGDFMRLTQILNNLLSNALKFTPKGSVELTVSLKSLKDTDCHLLFKIEDTGIGIFEQNIKHVFTPFHQSENYISREFGGTGLGLSIVKDLVDLFNGSISVDSKEGIGTTFNVVLPFKLSADTNTLNPIDELQEQETNTLAGYHILYVEDVESNQILVKNLFDYYGVECTIALNGETALFHTSTQSFDVILTDIQMPVMNGYEVAKAIRTQQDSKNIETPIIAFTAEPYSDSLHAKITDAGMQDLLTKPFQFDQLLSKIKKICPRNSTQPYLSSFQFYEWAFNHDRQRLNEFKDLLIQEMKIFEVEFNEHKRQDDTRKMRAEVHKMLPIVTNLKCKPLIDLFEQYLESDATIEDFDFRLRTELDNLLSFLNHLSY